MIIERIDTIEHFRDLGDEWNGLLASSPSDCVFLTHEWLFTWWKNLGRDRRLFIITARENGQLIGIMPLALRKAQYTRMVPRVLEFLGSGLIGSDYLDLIILKGREEEVIARFAKELNRFGVMLQLTQLNRKDCLASALASALQRNRWSPMDEKINVCPFISLTGHSWESWLQSLSASQRYNFNRRYRNLVKNEALRVEHVAGPEGAKRALDILIALHRKRWSSAGTSEAFQTPPVVAFHREFVELASRRGWLRLMLVWLGDIPAAALYGLHYGRRFYFYQSGFDPDFGRHSVGLVMMGLAIKYAIDEKASEYDLLHGDEEYKFHWTRQTRELGRLEIYPPDSRGTLYMQAIALNRAARQMAKRVLGKGV